MTRFKRALLILSAGLLACSLMTAPVGAKTWKVTVAAGHPQIFLWISTIHDTFIPYVNERLKPLGHEVVWKETYGGTACKLGGCLEALQSGIVEMANVGVVFEAAKMPLHNVTFFVPFGSGDPATVLDAMTEVIEKVPELKDEWTRHNAVNLAGSAVDTYNLFAKYPVKSVDDVKGHKIGTAGPMATWLKGTGAVGVATNLRETYNSLQLGVFEGIIGFNTAGLGIRMYEVAPYLSEVNFGAQYPAGFAINKKFFDSLPPQVQQVFRDAGKHYNKTLSARQIAKAAQAAEIMKKAGAKFIPFSDEERAKWAHKMPNVAMEWAADMEKKGLPGKKLVKAYLDALRARNVKLVRDWDKE